MLLAAHPRHHCSVKKVADCEYVCELAIAAYMLRMLDRSGCALATELAGGQPNSGLKARLNAASEPQPTVAAISATLSSVD